jgi:hypothetical protein
MRHINDNAQAGQGLSAKGITTGDNRDGARIGTLSAQSKAHMETANALSLLITSISKSAQHQVGKAILANWRAGLMLSCEVAI